MRLTQQLMARSRPKKERFRTAATAIAMAFVLASSVFSTRAEAWVDLHAHWFIQESVPFKLWGSFWNPPNATSWRNRFVSRVDEKTIRESEVSVAVIAFYATPLYMMSLKDSVRFQLGEARKFLARNPDFVQVRNPTELEAAMAAKKKALVFSLEGASGVLDTEESIKEFVDEAGICLVTIVHFTDDEVGGASILAWPGVLLNIKGLIMRYFKPESRGLTAHGKHLLEMLEAHHVWIDLAHAAEPVFDEISSRSLAADKPLFVSHSSLFSQHPHERAIRDHQVARVRKSRGILGLIPAADMLSGKPNQTDVTFQNQLQLARSFIGTDSVLLGSDFNAPIRSLPCNPDGPFGKDGGCHGLEELGFAHYGHLKALSVFMRSERTETEEATFLRAWKRIFQ